MVPTAIAHRIVQRGQRGFSLLTMIFFAFLIGGAFLTAAKVTPSVIEYFSIIKAVKRASTGTSMAEVRRIFDRSGQTDDITSISGQDLEILKDGDKTTVKFAYRKEIALAGPVALLITYQGSSK